jgi:putative addiction module component (TIGR02574 family)
MADPARILEEALELSPGERARVARALIDSLDNSADEDADALWQAEVRARLDAVAAGAVELEDWAAVRDRLRAKPMKP